MCPAQFVGVVCADSFVPSRSANKSWPLARLEIPRETQNQNFPREPRSGKFAFPPTSRAKTVERRGRVDCSATFERGAT